MGSAIPTHLRCPRTRAPWVGEDFQPPYPSFSARAPQAMTQVVMGYFGVQSRGGREVVDAAFATVLALFDAIDGPSHRDIVCLVDGDGYDTAMAIAYWGEAEAFSRWIDDPRVAGWRAFKNQYWPAH